MSLALAGFSGVVVGLRGTRDGELAAQDLFGLFHILASSGAAMAFSLLPSVLHAGGVDESVGWTTTSLLLGTTMVLGGGAWAWATRTTTPRYPLIYWPFVVSGVLLGVALLATASGLIDYRGSLLPLGLLWLLLVGFAQFSAFLVLSWARPT